MNLHNAILTEVSTSWSLVSRWNCKFTASLGCCHYAMPSEQQVNAKSVQVNDCPTWYLLGWPGKNTINIIQLNYKLKLNDYNVTVYLSKYNHIFTKGHTDLPWWHSFKPHLPSHHDTWQDYYEDSSVILNYQKREGSIWLSKNMNSTLSCFILLCWYEGVDNCADQRSQQRSYLLWPIVHYNLLKNLMVK